MWQIKVGTTVYTEDDVVFGDIVAVGELAGVHDWSALDPTASPKVMASWVAVALSRKGMVPLEQTMRFVNEQPALAIMEAFTQEAPETPPEGSESDETGDDATQADRVRDCRAVGRRNPKTRCAGDCQSHCHR